MAKVNRFGQAYKLSDREILEIRRNLRHPHQKLFLDIARFTGERWGSLVQLSVNDVYENPAASIPRPEITFQARTRKATPDGRRITRQVPMHPDLQESLSKYTPPLSGYLFPGHRGNEHLTFDAAEKFLRFAVMRAGLGGKGISTHSFRVTVITNLFERGGDLPTIKQFTGHSTIQNLERYVAKNTDRLKAVVGLL